MPVPVSNTVNCYLCGAQGSLLEMSVMGSPALGPVVDFALSVTWLCPDPCYDKARYSELIRTRIYAEHDAKERQNKANLQAALKETESAQVYLATLPDGLRVTESDIERVRYLDGDYSVENLQDEETVRAAFRLLRNYKRLPYYHATDTVRELWDFDELKTRLENLGSTH